MRQFTILLIQYSSRIKNDTKILSTKMNKDFPFTCNNYTILQNPLCFPYKYTTHLHEAIPYVFNQVLFQNPSLLMTCASFISFPCVFPCVSHVSATGRIMWHVCVRHVSTEALSTMIGEHIILVVL